MKEFFLIRHGESEGNKLGVIQGHHDFPLSQTGKRQANDLGEYFLQKSIIFNDIYTSDSLRAKQTCRIVSNFMKKDFKESESLREMNLGVWQSQKKSDIFKDINIKDAWNKRPSSLFIENAETLIQAQNRIYDFILSSLKENTTTAYFGHGTTLCLFLCKLMEKPNDLLWDYKHNNTGWSRIILDNNNKILKISLNITEHLKVNTLNWF